MMLWEINNPNKFYLEDCIIHEFIDKETLMDYIFMECCDMRVIDSNSGAFHERVKNFFKIHKWNIDRLCKSLEFKYEPLNNYHGTEQRKLERDIAFDSVTDRDQKDDKVTDRDWSEKGSSNEQDVHYVSAYNDKESPEQIGTDSEGRPIYKFNDTEHDRDTITISYSKSGDEDISVNDVLEEDIHKNDVTDEDVVENKSKEGNNGQSYQSLIEEERKQAQFNIYKWILNHWFHELMVCVW